MKTFDAATEQWLAQMLEDAPPFTSAQLDLIQRTYGRVQLAPETRLAPRHTQAAA